MYLSRWFFCFLFLGASGSVSFAQTTTVAIDGTPKYSNEYMNIGVGARFFSMGSVGVTTAEGIAAGYWNPSGLVKMQAKSQIGLMHSSYFGGLSNYDYAAFALSIDSITKVGVTGLRFAVDDIPDTRLLVDANGVINYDNIQYFSSADYGFLFSVGRRIPLFGGVDIGASVKILHRVVGSFSKAWGFGLDFGFQKKIKGWNIGWMVRDIFGTFNAWSHNTLEVDSVYRRTGNAIPENSLEVTLPKIIMSGSKSLKIRNDFSLLSSLDVEMTVDGRRNVLLKSNFLSVNPKVGVEFDYKQMIFLRGGINQIQQIKQFDGTKMWTVQPNLGVGISIQQFTLDYALTDIGNLAPGLFSHVFSIFIDFVDEK